MRNSYGLLAIVAAAVGWLPSARSFAAPSRILLLPAVAASRNQAPNADSSLRLIAKDLPMETEGDHSRKKKSNGDNENEESSSSSAWIPTQGGGFLPNFRSRLMGNRPQTDAAADVVVVNPVHEIVDIQAYKEAVVDEPRRIVCVRFYAPWCRACRAVEGKFRKLAKENPGVKFVQVPLTKDNAYLHQGLGIPSLPFAHVYYPRAGLVEERSINKRQFQSFQRALETYVDGECEVWYDDDGLVDGSSMAGRSESE